MTTALEAIEAMGDAEEAVRAEARRRTEAEQDEGIGQHPSAPWSQLAIEHALEGAREAAQDSGVPHAEEADGARICLVEGVGLWVIPPEARGDEAAYRAALLYELRGIAERG